jgi:rhamnosyltransferase
VDDVCAVVITHHPDARVGERLARVARQVGRVVVVDNASAGPARPRLLALQEAGRIRLLENAGNRGVAAALNRGVGWARSHGFSWALLLDQDTEVDPELVRGLRWIYAAHPHPERIGVVGARSRSDAAPPPSPREAARGWRRRETVITSGSLLRLAILERIGPFRDEFFIDHVDDDYCLRLAACGLGVLQSTRPLMDHALGAPSRVRLPWRESQTSNHSALRRYFMTRNHVVLIRQYWRVQPRWALRTAYARMRSTLLMVVFEAERGRKLRAILRGLVDGMAGRLGPGPGGGLAGRAGERV